MPQPLRPREFQCPADERLRRGLVDEQNRRRDAMDRDLPPARRELSYLRAHEVEVALRRPRQRLNHLTRGGELEHEPVDAVNVAVRLPLRVASEELEVRDARDERRGARERHDGEGVVEASDDERLGVEGLDERLVHPLPDRCEPARNRLLAVPDVTQEQHALGAKRARAGREASRSGARRLRDSGSVRAALWLGCARVLLLHHARFALDRITMPGRRRPRLRHTPIPMHGPRRVHGPKPTSDDEARRRGPTPRPDPETRPRDGSHADTRAGASRAAHGPVAAGAVLAPERATPPDWLARSSRRRPRRFRRRCERLSVIPERPCRGACSPAVAGDFSLRRARSDERGSARSPLPARPPSRLSK